jgi:hypothetical protein
LKERFPQMQAKQLELLSESFAEILSTIPQLHANDARGAKAAWTSLQHYFTDPNSARVNKISIGADAASSDPPGQRNRSNRKPQTVGLTVEQRKVVKAQFNEEKAIRKQSEIDKYKTTPRVYGTDPEGRNEDALKLKVVSDLLRGRITGVPDKIAQDASFLKLARRLDGLEKSLSTVNSKLFANNFGADGYQASSHEEALLRGQSAAVKLLARMQGTQVPGGDMSSAVEIIEQVLEGSRLHPKRYGAIGRSFVLPTTANKIIPMNTVTAGDTIYVVCIANAAYKGGAIFRTTAAAPITPIVVGYFSPDRDPEELGVSCASLYSKLSISAPMVIGGTSLNLAQMILELAVTMTGPLSILSGKMAPVARNRSAPAVVIGPEKHSLHYFNASESVQENQRFSSFDKQNLTLVKVPNSSTLSASAGAARSATTGYYSLILPVTDNSVNANANGWIFAAPGSVGLDYTLTTTFVDIFSLATSVDYLRHLLFGDFKMTIQLRNAGATVDAAPVRVRTRITYSDGSYTENMILYGARVHSTSNSPIFNIFDTRGDSASSAKNGLFITDVKVAVTGATGCGIITGNNGGGSFVSFDFYDVSAQSTYLCGILSGVTSSSQVSVTLDTHTEVTIDPSAQSSAFVTPTGDLPYDDDYLPNLVRVHALMGPMSSESTNFSASGWSNFVKKIKPMIKVVAPYVNPMIHYAGRKLVDRAFGAQEYSAKGFGDGENKRMSSDYSFPAIRNDSGYVSGEMVPVFKGGSHLDEEIEANFGKVVGYNVTNFDGRSGTLAQLLACLNEKGIKAPFGSYTGEVTQISVNSDYIAFTLLPVDKTGDKLAIDNHLTGYFGDGWFFKGRRLPFDVRHLFPQNKAQFSVSRSKDFGEEYPDVPCFNILVNA